LLPRFDVPSLARRLGLLLAFAVLPTVAAACGDAASGTGSSESNLVSAAPQPFDLAAQKPRAKATFSTPSGLTELCIVPGHFIADGFTDDDASRENALCSIDLNAAPSASPSPLLAAGLAPKADAFNPATDVHLVTTEVGRDVVESFDQANAKVRKARAVGRLVSSLDETRFGEVASYTPSVIGYYGTSRMLGGAAAVMPSVWRTLDVDRHARVADNGSRLTIDGSAEVKPNWASFRDADGLSVAKTALTYTTDGKQLYTALMSAETDATDDHDAETEATVEKSARFHALIDGRPIDATVGHDLAGAVQAIVPMQGMTEMLVLDAIMLEPSRFTGGRVASAPYVYFADGTRMPKAAYDAGASHPAGSSGVTVARLFLSDVAGGLVTRSPDAVRASPGYAFLGQIAHLSPDLYVRVQRLAGMVQNPEFESFARSEWRFSERDWLRYREMTLSVATLLHDRCSVGALVLDLDVGKHLARANLAPGAGCTL
jgi:hypothetical protein